MQRTGTGLSSSEQKKANDIEEAKQIIDSYMTEEEIMKQKKVDHEKRKKARVEVLQAT